MDKINQTILKLLRKNGRMSWQDIGKQVNMTGQAVSARVQLMEHKGVISGYTIKEDALERHYITVFMNDGRFDAFEKFIKTDERIESAHKVTGEGCYQLVLASNQPKALELFLDELSRFARQKVSSVIRKIK